MKVSCFTIYDNIDQAWVDRYIARLRGGPIPDDTIDDLEKRGIGSWASHLDPKLPLSKAMTIYRIIRDGEKDPSEN